jgi:hypothetical protein
MTISRRWSILWLSLALAVGLGWLVLSKVTAAGGKVETANYPVATFTPAADSTHNNAGSSVCAAGFQASEPIKENKGDLNTSKGSFLERVGLPDGTTARTLSLFVNDNDGDDGTYAFLIRKQIKKNLSPQFDGYKVMASTKSTGAVLNTMREFTDSSVKSGKIDNAHFDYYLEVVNCATVEPFAVQIGFTK